MAPKPRKNGEDITPDGIFKGMVVFLVERGVQPRRIQIWTQKLVQMGATVEDRLSRRITHILAMNLNALLQKVDRGYMIRFKGNTLSYQWLEDSLKQGERVSEDSYRLERELDPMNELGQAIDVISSEPVKRNHSDDDRPSAIKKTRPSANNKDIDAKNGENEEKESGETLNTKKDSPGPFLAQPSSSAIDLRTNNHQDDHKESLLYSAPDLNKNITEIFGKLINIYRALGDDRRSFSYYKAIHVIEKLPFKIDSVDQVKDLPAIGKSMQDHIHEVITTGKLSKLEHFEKDEKVRTITLFGEVWGIGPATALKLYEKGYRTLTDLEKEESLTSSQRLGLNYFDDIKKRIPRNEVNDMEALLQKAGEELLPGVIVVCGGSYRRGKATCGDMDIVITHPDGESHKGFLPRYVQHLKDMKFLREDLVFSIHSTEGTDSGVDTYFGLCKYPGREQRHRIDLKVYPRDIYAFGLIAWTGNDVLNRRLRLLAESKGYRLDDTGLFLATQSSGGKKGAKSSTSVRCKTEKEVLDFLGYPWLEPHERNL